MLKDNIYGPFQELEMIARLENNPFTPITKPRKGEIILTYMQTDITKNHPGYSQETLVIRRTNESMLAGGWQQFPFLPSLRPCFFHYYSYGRIISFVAYFAYM